MSTKKQILQYACDLLARREHSRKELQHKLMRRSDSVALIETVLDMLAAKGLQDDTRFTEAFIHCRVNKGQGPLKIQQALRRLGIEQDIISRCIELNSVDWFAVASKARIKRFGLELPIEYKERVKQHRFLYGRGFDNAQITLLFRETV